MEQRSRRKRNAVEQSELGKIAVSKGALIFPREPGVSVGGTGRRVPPPSLKASLSRVVSVKGASARPAKSA